MNGTTLTERLLRIVAFWEASHEISSIHMSRAMHKALMSEVSQLTYIKNSRDIEEFKGYRIRYCDIDGCDDGTTAPCFSVCTGRALPVVHDKNPTSFYNPNADTMNIAMSALDRYKSGLINIKEFEKEFGTAVGFQPNTVILTPTNDESPPEGLVWE